MSLFTWCDNGLLSERRSLPGGRLLVSLNRTFQGELMKGLSLTRKTGESCVFRVGDQEVVVIVEEAGVGRVRLRLVANQSVVIMRRELEQPSR
jgi:hypothetical protein